ncbi:MAG: hypothetical protein J6T57_04565 [Alphaproteobacteria bacterium]|nr:hypothetical protein [Alphaproteobacteria bacterium]
MTTKLNEDYNVYYKKGGIVYDLPTGAREFIKKSKRNHIRFNGMGGNLARLYIDEISR